MYNIYNFLFDMPVCSLIRTYSFIYMCMRHELRQNNINHKRIISSKHNNEEISDQSFDHFGRTSYR